MKLRWLFVVLIALIAGSACSRDPNVAKKIYLESGNRYFDRGKYKEASMMYRNALKKDLRYGDAYYRLGLTLLKVADTAGAYRSFVRALDLLPAGADRNDTSGKLTDIYLSAYMADRQRGQATEVELKEFIKRPQVTKFDRLRAEGYIDWRAGDLDGALLKFKDANDIKTDGNLVLAYTQALIGKGRYDEANKLALDLIAKSKDFGPIYDVLYVEYVRRNLPAEAEKIRRLKADNNPKNLEFHLQLAAHYYLLNKPDEASRIIEALVADKKTFPNAREKAGDFYLLFRNYDQAIAYYRGGLNGSKEDWLTFQRKIADTLIAQGRRDEALALVENQILKQYPKDPVALALRATLWLEMGDPSQKQQALTDLEATVSKLPQNAVVRFNLGRAYYAKGDLDQARTQFKAAVDFQPDYLAPRQALIEIHLLKGEYTPALQYADETLSYAQGNLQTRLLRAQALQGLGKLDDARNELQTVLKQSPNSVEAIFRLGLLELNAKNYPGAARTFEQCMKASQNNFPCVVGAAEVYSKQKQYDKAIDFLSAELKKSPDRREIRLALANTSVLAANYDTELRKTDAAKTKYDAAVAIFSAMLSKEPMSPDLHLRLAETSRLMGKIEVAIEHFRRVQQLQPKNPDAAIWLALLLHVTGREAEAKQHYLEALQLQPNNAVALNNLAFVITEQGGDLDVALTYAQRAKQQAPQSDEISDTLAWIYFKKKLTPNALSIYDGLVVKQPANSTFRYHRGLALLQKGDKVQAKKELQTALLNKPSPAEQAKINEALLKTN
jgi:tetratricopeptide (TPR) repeat protein